MLMLHIYIFLLYINNFVGFCVKFHMMFFCFFNVCFGLQEKKNLYIKMKRDV